MLARHIPLSSLSVVALLVLGLVCLPTPNVTAQESAELIYDQELKRWLTPEEIGHVQEYLTEEEAAKVVLPDSERIRAEVLSLGPQQKTLVEKRIGWTFPESSFNVYVGETNGQTDGYAVVQNTIGKYRPITYMVGIDPSGHVTNFEVLVYRESRGNEIATKRFNYQYEGKTLRDPIRINRDIINITGATMSVRSASAGVKRALVLVDEYYLKPLGRGMDTTAPHNSDKGFLQTLFGF